MRILFTAYSPLGVGGAEMSMYLLALALQKNGHEIFIASTEQYPEIKTFIFKKIRKIPCFCFQSRYLGSFFSKLIIKEKIDIIHSHDRLTAIPSIYASKKTKISCVNHYRDYWFMCPKSSCLMPDYTECSNCNIKNLIRCSSFFRLPWNLYKLNYLKRNWKFLNKSDAKITISKSIEQKLDSVGIYSSKIIPNLVNISEFKKDKNFDIRKKYDLNKIIITFVGSLEYHKGVLNIVEIAKNLIDKNVSFILVGDGPLKNVLEDKIKINNLKNIVLLGNLPYKEVINIYLDSDIILFPSLWQEPFGRVAIEAMASSKPIIASCVGGVKDIIINNETGFLVEPNNINEWHAKLSRLITNSSLRKKLGENGKKLVKSKYDSTIIAGEIEKIYKKLK